MYEGHLPASGIQQHSAGELFPCFIVIYGDGTAQWVNPEKQFAGTRRLNQHLAIDHCRYMHSRGWDVPAWLRGVYHSLYHKYCRGER